LRISYFSQIYDFGPILCLMRYGARLLAFAAVAVLAVAAATPPAATVTQSGSDYTLSNGYVKVTLASQTGASITSLTGDFEGTGNYGEELLAHGFDGAGFSLQSVDNNTVTSSSHLSAKAPKVTIVSNGPNLAAIKVEGVQAGEATEIWTLELESGARGLVFNTTGSMPSGSKASTVVRHTLLATPLSVYGFYPNDGVVQMMNAEIKKAFMPSARPLDR
jgi:hypothetical protein